MEQQLVCMVLFAELVKNTTLSDCSHYVLKAGDISENLVKRITVLVCKLRLPSSPLA